MILLKEDGSLDIERIEKLPLKEHSYQLCHFTKEQYKEYRSKVPLKKSKGITKPIHYDSLEDFLNDTGAVEAHEMLNNLRTCRDSIREERNC